jgi:hypothetical protein
MTEFFEGHLYGKSKSFDENMPIDGSFDLFIFTVGWEERCTKIIYHNSDEFLFDKGILLSFINNGKKGWNPKYLKKIRDFVKKQKKKQYSRVILESLVPNYSGLTDICRVFKMIKIKQQNLHRPLKIGFDISSCPRVVFLQILHYCIENDITQSISFFYAEGIYDFDISNDEVFVAGDWDTIAIPGYSGKNINLQRKDYFILSFGFEQKGYLGWIEECDTLNKVGVLFPHPPYIPKYDKIGRERLKKFKMRLDLNNENKKLLYAEAKAGDAIDAWKKFDLLLAEKNDYNVTFLPYGPKPHSLAMGLRCLLNENFVLIYRISSKGYHEIDVKPLGKIWRYEIKNLALY